MATRLKGSSVTLRLTDSEGTVTEIAGKDMIVGVDYSLDPAAGDVAIAIFDRQTGSVTYETEAELSADTYDRIMRTILPVEATSRAHARRLARQWGRTGKQNFRIPERWQKAFKAEVSRSSLFAFVRVNGETLGQIPSRLFKLNQHVDCDCMSCRPWTS